MPDATPLFDPHFLGKLEYLALVARRQQSGAQAGQNAGRKIGDGLEFADHREYVPGDELRYLDWPAYGRLGKLFIRMFHQHTDRVVHVLVDCSASMKAGAGEGPAPGSAHPHTLPADVPSTVRSASKFDSARRIAAALAYLALNNLDRATVSGFRNGRVEMTPATTRNRGQIFLLMQYLEGLTADGVGGQVSVLRQFAEITREPGQIILVSDFLEPDPLGPALDSLLGRGHGVLGVQVLAPSEAEPTASAEFHGRLRLVDSEGGRTVRLPVSQSLVEAYRRESAEFFAALDEAFVARRAALVRMTTDIPFERFVLDLIRRGLAERSH